MVVCLYRSVTDLRMVQLMPLPPHHLSCFIKIQTGFTFLVPAYPGCPGKEAVKQSFINRPTHELNDAVDLTYSTV